MEVDHLLGVAVAAVGIDKQNIGARQWGAVGEGHTVHVTRPVRSAAGRPTGGTIPHKDRGAPNRIPITIGGHVGAKAGGGALIGNAAEFRRRHRKQRVTGNGTGLRDQQIYRAGARVGAGGGKTTGTLRVDPRCHRCFA